VKVIKEGIFDLSKKPDTKGKGSLFAYFAV
jgi:hypothetical protein